MKTSSISLSTSEKLGIISNLATMLTAGIPILETVDSLLEDSKGNQKKLLQTVHESLTEGNHLSAAFAKFPNIFDKVTINIIEASEEAGTLDITLKDLKDNIKKETEFRDKVKGALTYPVIIMFVFLGVFLMILIVVVPKLATVFSRLNADLPLPTQIMIAMSNMLTTYTIPVVLGIMIIVGSIIFLVRTQTKLVLGILFQLPLLSELIKEIDLTRFTRSMFLLLNAGITITTALELSSEVVFRRDLNNAINNAREMIIAGKKFSEGLKAHKGKFPAIMIKVVEAGEKSGSLERSMEDISEYLDYQVSATLKTLTALLEPLMLVVVGVLVGGMMLAIIAPIYGLIGQVGPR